MLYYATTIPMVHDFRLMLSFVFGCPMFKEEYVGEVVEVVCTWSSSVLAASGSNYYLVGLGVLDLILHSVHPPSLSQRKI